MSYFQLFLLVIEGPLRFFLVNAMLTFSLVLLSVSIKVQDGYPWPGFISYRLPNLIFLFLGSLVAIAFLQVRVLSPIRSWGRLLTFLLTSLACSMMLLAITPGRGLLGVLSLFVVGFVTVSAFTSPPRKVFLARIVLLAFVLVLLKFVVVPQGTLDLVLKIAGAKELLAGLGDNQAVSSLTEYLIFLALLLMTGALALQWPLEDDSYDMTWLLGPQSSRPALMASAQQVTIAENEGRVLAVEGSVVPQLPERTETEES